MKQYLRRAGPLRSFGLGALGLVLLLLLAPSAHANPPLFVQPPALDSAASNALLQFTSQGHVLGFQAGGFYVSNATYALRVEFIDANPVAPVSDAADSNSDERGAPPLGRVTYPNLWDGITLTLDSARGGVVSSSYRVEAAADPWAIRLRYNAPVVLNEDGTLTIAYATGEMSESAPVAWQEKAGEPVAVRVGFVRLGEREVGFGLGDYDAGQPLFIDPTLTWNTFLGGGGTDRGNAIAVDGTGNVYIAGTSDGTWGTPKRFFTSKNDAFAAKLSPSGVLVWNTFLGGASFDYGNAIAFDGSGNVYVAGASDTTWQGTNQPVRSFTNAADAFVAKLDSSGALAWNTFVGGWGLDDANGIAVDGAGNIYIAGASDISWQGANPPQRTYTNGYDGFAAKLDSTGAIGWNTFLGGTGSDFAWGVAVDGSQNVYIAGSSDASWHGAALPIRPFGANTDAFAVKLNSSGALAWNTFLGGSGWDSGVGITVDGSGNVYVAGDSSATWQGTGAPLRAHSGSYDAFVAKLNSSGGVTWNTFLGGGGPDYGHAIVRDVSGNLYVAGFSYATWQGASAPVRAYSGSYDAFAVKLSPNGAVTWNTFLGASSEDYGNGIAIDGNGNVYVAGVSGATWQGSSPPIRAFTGSDDAFVVKLGPSGALAWNTFFGGSSDDYGRGIAVDGSGNVYVAGFSYSTWGSPIRNSSGGSDAFVAKLNPAGGLTWNTFLGSNGNDNANGIAVDGSGNVYVVGSSSMSWQGSILPARGYTGSFDGFVAKLNPNGALTWNTFLGGGGYDDGNAIAVDTSGNILVAGSSSTTWQGAAPPVRDFGANSDAFAAKLSPSGALAWNTFLGGSGYDSGVGVAVDASRNVYVAGYSSAAWQGSSASVRAYSGSFDAFAVKLSPSGGLTWNTFLGGTGADFGAGIAIDGSGNAYVAGNSSATWQGTSAPVRAHGGSYDAFAAKLNSSGVLAWNTFLGGSEYDWGNAIAVDGSRNVYAAGYSMAAWGSPIRAYGLGIDGFAVKLNSSGALVWNAFVGGSGNDWVNAMAADSRGNVFVAGQSDATWQGRLAPRNAYTIGMDAFAGTIVAFDGYLPLIRK